MTSKTRQSEPRACARPGCTNTVRNTSKSTKYCSAYCGDKARKTEKPMYLKIPLRLHGLDLRDIDAYDRLNPELAELFWSADGEVSLAIVLIDAPVEPEEAVEAAVIWAHRIAELMPGVWVTEATYEIRDIAEDDTLHLTSPQLDALNLRIRALASLLEAEDE